LLKIPIKIPTSLQDYLEIFQKFKAKKIKLEDMKDETNKMIFSLYNISEKEINSIKNDI
jgi:hypothetical protein